MATTLSSRPTTTEARAVLARWGVHVDRGTDITYALSFLAGMLATVVASNYAARTGWVPVELSAYVAWAAAFAWSPLPVSIPSVATGDIRDAWGLNAGGLRRSTGLYPYLLRLMPVATVVHLAGFVAFTVRAWAL